MVDLGLTAYITADEANSYYATILDTDAWDDSDDGTREKALTQATLKIDSLSYYNAKVDEEQEHAFPRGDQTETPKIVLQACAQLALNMLDDFSDTDFDDNNIIASGYSSVRDTKDPSMLLMHEWVGLPRTVYTMLLPYLDVGSSKLTIHRTS